MIGVEYVISISAQYASIQSATAVLYAAVEEFDAYIREPAKGVSLSTVPHERTLGGRGSLGYVLAVDLLVDTSDVAAAIGTFSDVLRAGENGRITAVNSRPY